MKQKMTMLCGMTAALSCCIGISAMAASDGLIDNGDGTAYYYQDGTVLTGNFCISPDHVSGDVTGDDLVSSTDAAAILTAAAFAGSGNLTASDQLVLISPSLPDAETALLYADINGDGRINASDAAGILEYAAVSGTVTEIPPLGSVLYCADATGLIATGWLSSYSNDTHYADEDFSLHTGWLALENEKYYFDRMGVMLTGWQSIGGKLYHFSNAGRMDTGLVTLADGTYYFNASGVMQTGIQTIDGTAYYFGTDGRISTGWVNADGATYYFTEDGMHTGWLETTDGTYYFDASGIMQTGLVELDDCIYYFNLDGKMCTGTVVIDGESYNFNENGKLYDSFLTIDEKTYYYNSAGFRSYGGFLEIDDDLYFFDDNGVMATGFVEYGSQYYFESDGKLLAECYDITPEKTAILENAALEPHDSYIIWNRQVSPEKKYTTITLKEKDIAILEEFANTYFTEDMTMAQKMWITQQWIHKKVDYAYAGEKWNSIVNLSYVEAIFVNRMGQCVQYNGAMAAMMIWFGYDVYMVKGWTDTGNQHFWTEVVIDGTTYLMECGNYGKNGNWHDFLTPIS